MSYWCIWYAIVPICMFGYFNELLFNIKDFFGLDLYGSVTIFWSAIIVGLSYGSSFIILTKEFNEQIKSV